MTVPLLYEDLRNGSFEPQGRSAQRPFSPSPNAQINASVPTQQPSLFDFSRGEREVRLPVMECAEQPKGAKRWMELANQPECYVWNDGLQPDAPVTWTGGCAGGLAQRTGTLTWILDSDKKTMEGTGLLQDGKKHGGWVICWPNGDVSEGLFVQGKKHGLWVIRNEDGSVREVIYENGRLVND